MKDSSCEFWIQENLPDDKSFSPEAVKILLRLAWQAALERQRLRGAEEERERLHGPLFI